MKKFKTIQVGSLAYEVWFASDEEVPELKGSNGVTLLRDCRIYLDKELENNQPRLRDTLIHELLHAAWETCGATHFIENYSGLRTVKAKNQFEETLVRMQTSHLIAALDSAGLLVKRVK